MSTSQSNLTCSMCGHTFDPADQASCQGCPLQPGCSLVRCPVCGFETVNPDQSHLARLFSRIFLRRAGPPAPTATRRPPT